MSADTATTAAFLRYVYEAAIDAGVDGRVVISERQPNGSKVRYLSRAYRLDQLDDAADGCARISTKGRNGYCRVHLIDRDLSAPTKRGGAVDTRYVTHLAADVDIAGPGHAPPPDGLPHPPDIETAVELIDATLLPSCVIASGGGLYPIWRLAEVVELADDEARQRFRNIGRRLDRALGSHGYHVDATVLDLARIIRPPGVTNHKPGRDPRPVTVLRGYCDGAGDYTLAAIDRALPALPEPEIVKPSAPIRSSSTDSAPWTVLDDLYSIEDILAADPCDTWERVNDQADGSGQMVSAWRRSGSSADYSIKAGSGGALIVWSSTLAGRLGIDPGAGISRWQLLCAFAGRDPRQAARWSR